MAEVPPLPAGYALRQQAPTEAATPPLPQGYQIRQSTQPGPVSAAEPPQLPPRLGTPGDAIGEPAIKLATSMVSTPVSGIGMLLAGGTNALGISDVDLVALGERIQRALTYEPRTRIGQAGDRVISYPFEKLAKAADAGGQKTTDAAQSIGASPKVAALAGATVNTGIQFLPALALRRVGKSTPAQAAQTAAETEARARNYVATNTGLDFDALAQGTREALTKVASNSSDLAKLDARAFERQAKLEALDVPIKATAPQLTRNPVDLRNESNIAATQAGADVRSLYVDQNRKILENVERLKGGRVARGEVETGRAVQDAARTKLANKKAEVDKLYTEARAAGELQGKVSPRPVLDVLKSAADKSDLKWVQGWLNDNKVVQQTPSGTVVNKLSLETLEGLRRDATARVANGGSDGYHARKIVRAIDKATDGAGGVKYKAARKSRTEQALEFDEQAAVNRLVSDKSRTDRALALEDTWNDVVLRGSLDDLVKVKRSLLTGGDAATRTAGKNAWRDLRAETIANIEREATKGVARFEDGTPNVTPAALKRAVDRIGTEKLDQIFGSGTRKKIDAIVDAARELKTQPPQIHTGSSTFSNVLSFLERSLTGGNVVTGAVKSAARVGEASRQVGKSMRDPLRDAAAATEGKNKLRKLAPLGAVQGANE